MALLEVFDDVKDKVVCDVDPNAGLLWWRHICYDVKTFLRKQALKNVCVTKY